MNGRRGDSDHQVVDWPPPRRPRRRIGGVLALVASVGVSVITGAGMMAEWSTLALYWYSRPGALILPAAASLVDPIFSRPVAFYLFTLPAWQLLSSWLLTLTVFVFAVAAFFVV